jgi:hypothetical protein
MSQKAAGSNRDEVTGFCTSPNLASRTMALGSTQHLAEAFLCFTQFLQANAF